MPLTVHCPKKGRPLKAWEGMDPNEGVRTRHRFTGSGSALSTSHQESSQEISSAKENKLETDQRKASKEGYRADLILTDPKEVKEHSKDVHVRGSDRKLSLSSEQQSPASLNVVTTCEDNVSQKLTTVIPCEGSNSTSTTESNFQQHKDGEESQPQTFNTAPHEQKLSSISGSPKQTSMRSSGSSRQQYWETVPVFDPVMPAQMPTEPAFHTNYYNNEIHLDALQDTLLGNDFESLLALHPNLMNSNVETDSSSAIIMNNAQETIDQLRAANEDLRSANEYYRLMSDITMKAAALRRGCE